MGFFSKKPKENKEYECGKAIEIVHKNPNYSAIPVGGGKFKIVRDVVANKEIDIIKQKRKDFINDISGNGAYNNIKVKNSNNYYVPPRYNSYENNYIGR
ncbi:MAG: hypothetical protein V8R81_04980 [Clostridia bacterium]